MKKLDGIVFDPPRAGAAAQAAEIAKSAVPRLVAVSCNPATLARDLRALLDGGYEISRVQPVDQFLWSPHIEVAVHLTRR
jgi:23S rRNA (uracil1939-C5)-methyltransferase